MEWPRAAAFAAPVALALVLGAAPPADNAWWGVNGLHSLVPAAHLVALLVAAAAAGLAWRSPRGRALPIAAAVVLALALALPGREVLHVLGDSLSRWGAIANYVHGAVSQSFTDWARQLHAQPLDAALWLGLVGAVTPADASPGAAIALVSLLLGLAYLGGAWRLARALDPAGENTMGLWLALVANGSLLAFAGYAESAGPLLAASVWFWACLLAPLDRPRRGVAMAVAWAVAALAHRSSLALLVPLFVRLAGPAAEGDDPRARRAGRIAAAAAFVLVAAVGMAFGGRQLGGDLRELLQGPAEGAWESLPTDLANLLVLLAPLALLAAPLAGRDALRRFAADPRARAVLLAALAFAPLAFPLPVAGSGLGYQRDWDLALPFGLALTLAAAMLLGSLPAARRRAALVVAVPVLALLGFGWVGVHADVNASLARVEAMLSGRPRLGPMQRSSLLLFAGDHDLAIGRPERAAPKLAESWRLVGSPARGLHAALAWVEAGAPDSAAHMLAAVRARGGLSARNRADADSLERAIRRLPAAPGAEELTRSGAGRVDSPRSRRVRTGGTKS